MKFVIKSLLFVYLIFQMTTSLRKCFDQYQNIMLTIILLAFSVIGLIGLVIGNRFILIVFSASMTLILIASITIYAIGKTDQDTMRPKVPYYVNVPFDRDAGDKYSTESKDGESRQSTKSLVSKWLQQRNSQIQTNSQQDGSTSARAKKTGRYNQNRTRQALAQAQRSNLTRLRSSKKSLGNQLTVSPVILDDYSDEPQQNVLNVPLGGDLQSRSMASIRPLEEPAGSSVRPVDVTADVSLLAKPLKKTPVLAKQTIQDISGPNPTTGSGDNGDDQMVEDEQWVAYEQQLYERYLSIVSQSIDLVLLIILAGWMALLLDEDSDQCFGTAERRQRSQAAKEAPVYNYNGVRYSIRPDASESPGRLGALH